MKIVHVGLSGYREGYGYQENLLTLKHRQLGYEVSIISYDRFNFYSNLIADEHGIKSYVDNNGIKVILLPGKNPIHIPLWVFSAFFDKTLFLYEKLVEEVPDIIFVHGLQMSDFRAVIKYKKNNPNVKVYVDNHGDFYNMPVNTFQQKAFHLIIKYWVARPLAKISERVWGVTPWRVEYLNKVYGITGSKVGLLVMGGDELLIDWDKRDIIRRKFRKQHHIPNDAFVLVSGGKIDKGKNIHLLIEAVKKIDDPALYLVIFGNYCDDMKAYEKETDSRIINLGWVASNAVYELFLSSDLGVFLGTHSVLWEQACASGLPCVFKDWDGGFKHVDLGGNCVLLNALTPENITNVLISIKTDRKRYENMCDIADRKCRKEFSYMNIAKKSIGINNAIE